MNAHDIVYMESNIRAKPGRIKNMNGLNINPDMRLDMMLFAILILDFRYLLPVLSEPQFKWAGISTMRARNIMAL